MKIGIDARLWNQTGVGRYIRNLVYNLQILDKKNDYVVFVMSEDFNDIKFKIQNSKFKILNCNIKWHSIAEQIKFTRLINKENLDLIHFPYYSIPVFYNRFFVVTLHDLIPLHFQTGKASTLPFPFYKFKFFAYRFVVSQAAKKAKKIIAPSNATKKDIVEYLKVPSSKIQTIYEGVDKALMNSVQSGNKKDHFLYIGNAYPHKNLEFLLKVFKDLPDLRLILVGKEDYFYKKLKKKAEKLNVTNVKFFGFATDAELSDLYKKAKALIIPSLIEGFGLPALEAMANNCLVIASDIPVLHEVCGDAAIYFDPKNSGDLAEKLNNVNTSNHQDKIEKGYKRVKQFSWEKTAQETLKLYKDLLHSQ